MDYFSKQIPSDIESTRLYFAETISSIIKLIFKFNVIYEHTTWLLSSILCNLISKKPSSNWKLVHVCEKLAWRLFATVFSSFYSVMQPIGLLIHIFFFRRKWIKNHSCSWKYQNVHTEENYFFVDLNVLFCSFPLINQVFKFVAQRQRACVTC